LDELKEITFLLVEVMNTGLFFAEDDFNESARISRRFKSLTSIEGTDEDELNSKTLF